MPLDHGYACVRVDSRGAGRSPGFVDPFSPRETRDFYECIEWAGVQPWSSGKVGLNGISYYGIMVAGLGLWIGADAFEIGAAVVVDEIRITKYGHRVLDVAAAELLFVAELARAAGQHRRAESLVGRS